ncbi:YopJ family acetyltransferase [Xenorhabdus lircayensis]|uniref:Uncharacterized protein n=1 Tax=Xenorhabdus lircayensis TaxID=2763499 RepID=A0ABS0U733_9GAMM|nr:YopJ family acetyltransferase [Xenorhabdus lircayensis]MBI6548565.1 hypothetical protein [Xenorhabdus lircayensis]
MPKEIRKGWMESYLSEYISGVESALNANIQMMPNYAIDYDKNYFLPHLVSMENNEKPGLNLSIIYDINLLPDHIRTEVNVNNPSIRLIVFKDKNSDHAIAFDCRYIKDMGISILGIESANSINDVGAREIARFCEELDFKAVTVPISLHIISSNQQYSFSECIIYSFILAKKMFKEQERMLCLHQKNLKNEFEVHDEFKSVIKPEWVDRYLLPLFMKHCQSTKRIDEYLSVELDKKILGDLDKKKCFVNKMNETLLMRHNRFRVKGRCIKNVMEIEEREYCNSIFLKRKRELEKLLLYIKKYDL